jgi:hypothetical protein
MMLHVLAALIFAWLMFMGTICGPVASPPLAEARQSCYRPTLEYTTGCVRVPAPYCPNPYVTGGY